MRDFYTAEAAEIRRWIDASQDPRLHQPIACSKCKFSNKPGTISCEKCQSPYLLEIARQSDPRAKIVSKLILAWGLIAGIIPASALAGQSISGAGGILIALLGVVLIGLILRWVFKLAPGETGEVRISA
jgi:hypothetical protein